MDLLTRIPTAAEIMDTASLIKPLIHKTPVMTCETLNRMSSAILFFKCENFQKVGAFKMRGAASAALRLSPALLKNGLATHSSGNHAQAVARAARELGVPAYIVMPENAPATKRAATEGYGGIITTCRPTLEAREQTLLQVIEQTGAHFIHPYDDYNVIAGQASCAIELIEEIKDLDAIIAPIGGGGLMSGTALSSRYFSPGTRVYGAEPEQVDDAYRSFKLGRLVKNETTDTIADGLRTNLGEKTFQIIRQHLDDIFTVSEAEILSAQKLVAQRMKIIIEPSCAVPLAAVMKNKEVFHHKRIGIILTGGNVD